jgi:hypothetical protein
MGRLYLGVVVTFAAILAPVAGGCSHTDGKNSSGGAITAAQDACSHCPGIQKATADGRCPECGMQVVNK